MSQQVRTQVTKVGPRRAARVVVEWLAGPGEFVVAVRSSPLSSWRILASPEQSEAGVWRSAPLSLVVRDVRVDWASSDGSELGPVTVE